MEKGLTEFTKSVTDILGDILNTEVVVTEDIQGEIEALERPGVVHKVASLYIQGMSYRGIADKLGVAATSVKALTKRESFKVAVHELSSEVIDAAKMMVKRNTLRAAEVLQDALDSPDEKIRVNVANSLLDRAGVKGAEKVEIKKTINNLNVLTDEEILLEYMKQLQASRVPNYGGEMVEPE